MTESTAAPTPFDTLTTGAQIRLTVATMPQAKGPTDTIARLMRRDPANARALRRAQEVRAKRLNRYIRGNRLWTSRETPAKVVRVVRGASWSLTYTPDIAPDLRSVAKYLTVGKA